MNYFWSILTSHGAEFVALIVPAALKATFLLGFVALLCAVFRRFSAATRHLLWSFVLCASLLLPFLSFINGWEIPILPASISTAHNTNELNEVLKTSETQLPQSFPLPLKADGGMPGEEMIQTNKALLESPSLISSAAELQTQTSNEASSLFAQLINWFPIVWIAGMSLLLFRLLIGFISTKLLARRATEIKETERVEVFKAILAEFNLKNNIRLLQSERIAMPVVCGIFHPRVLLPAGARQWSEERLRMVLLHELAHVARRDCLTQIMAQIACAFYWFNPFVWTAARRLRIEREQACDDYVLSIGTKPSDYAHHLLEIARSMQERSVFEWSQTSSVAMARKSQLEGRLVAILSRENRHNVLSRAATAGIIALICFLFITLAIIKPTVINAQKTEILQTVSDDEKDRAQTSLLDSFLSANSNQADQRAVDAHTVPEAIEKQENAAAANDSKALENGQIDKNIEQQITGEIKQSLEQNLGETAPPAPGVLPLPESAPEIPSPPDKTDSSQVNIKYQRESVSVSQEKSQDFIEEMASVGYTNLSIDELINLKAVGVNANYVRSLQALGFSNLRVRELTNMRALGVTPAFIEGIRNAGYKDLTAGQFANMRALGVTPEVINKYRNAGYDNLSVRNLTEFSAHNITTDFISSMNNLGFGKLSPRDLVELRVFGVNAEFVRQARNRLGNDLTLKQIIGLKRTGILKDKNKDKE
jgi:beta-lactamase regulating signal transducer with metallopeptidase domain